MLLCSTLINSTIMLLEGGILGTKFTLKGSLIPTVVELHAGS